MLVYDPIKIISIRESKGWNQAELARRARMSQPTVHALEKGKTRMPKFQTLAAIAVALGVDVQDILAERPKGKASEALDRQLITAYTSLSDPNKMAVLAVAQSLLQQQKPPKK